MESCCPCKKVSDTKDVQKGALDEEPKLGMMPWGNEEDFAEGGGGIFSPGKAFRQSQSKERYDKTYGEKLLEAIEDEEGTDWKEQEWNLDNKDVVMMLEQYVEEMKKQDK